MGWKCHGSWFVWVGNSPETAPLCYPRQQALGSLVSEFPVHPPPFQRDEKCGCSPSHWSPRGFVAVSDDARAYCLRWGEGLSYMLGMRIQKHCLGKSRLHVTAQACCWWMLVVLLLGMWALQKAPVFLVCKIN